VRVAGFTPRSLDPRGFAQKGTPPGPVNLDDPTNNRNAIKFFETYCHVAALHICSNGFGDLQHSHADIVSAG